MASPVVVVILVLSSDAQSPTTQSMVSATRMALGTSTVVVQEVATPPSDEQAVKAGSKAHADAVVFVTWPEAGAHAHLHLRVLREPKWADRELTFTAADAPGERGRSAGLAIATMLPTDEPAPGPPPPVVAPPPLTEDRPTPPPPRVKPKEGARTHVELDAAALGTFGFLGTAHAAGGELAARLVLPELVTFRLGGGVRFGDLDLPSDEAPTSAARVTAGVVVHAARIRSLDLGIGVDALVVRHSVSRFARDGTRETQSRFIGGGDLLFDAAYWFDRVAVFGAAGVELALGETRVIIGSETVATIPRARGVVVLGVRLRL